MYVVYHIGKLHLSHCIRWRGSQQTVCRGKNRSVTVVRADGKTVGREAIFGSGADAPEGDRN
jgi:hypothetical protein